MALIVPLAIAASACIPGSQTIRTGKALPSSVGLAQNGCESNGMLELVPSRTFARDDQATGGGYGYTVYTHTEEAQTGLALFRRDGTGPLPLADTLPTLQEPELAMLHLQRTEPYERKRAKTKVAEKIAIVGMVAMLVGVGLTTHGVLAGGIGADSMINTNEVLLGAAIMGGGALVGGGGAIAMLMLRPSGLEHTYHDLRAHLLLPGEDDTDAAVRGVDRYNEQVRARCR